MAGFAHRARRSIRYSSASHLPAFLVTGKSCDAVDVQQLQTPNLAIGWMPDAKFTEASCRAESNCKLLVFSDDVYETWIEDGTMMSLEGFAEHWRPTVEEAASGSVCTR